MLRDVTLGNLRYFRELLAGSEEGIASNILADRLKRLGLPGLEFLFHHVSRVSSQATARR